MGQVDNLLEPGKVKPFAPCRTIGGKGKFSVDTIEQSSQFAIIDQLHGVQ